jgi:hypothetical protein
MSTVRDYLRTMQLPWFFRKKFLLVFGGIVLLTAVVAAFFSWQLYTDTIEQGRTLRWKKITEPLALPLIFLMLYAIVILLWIAIKLKQFQRVMLSNVGTVFSPQQIQLENGEDTLAEVTISTRQSPGQMTRLGVFRITNRRVLHTQTISHKRIGILVGMEEPDLNYSIPLAGIRQCGFGLEAKDEKQFVVIERNGTIHVFSNITPREIEPALQHLNWKRSAIGNQISWIG